MPEGEGNRTESHETAVACCFVGCRGKVGFGEVVLFVACQGQDGGLANVKAHAIAG